MFRAAPLRFDLVMTDMAMPDMPGDRLAREMLLIRPDLPIVLCTGHSHRINEKKTTRQTGGANSRSGNEKSVRQNRIWFYYIDVAPDRDFQPVFLHP